MPFDPEVDDEPADLDDVVAAVNLASGRIDDLKGPWKASRTVFAHRPTRRYSASLMGIRVALIVLVIVIVAAVIRH